ncbi:MAG: hypothetical protein HY931_04070 [Candidatus Falkowbacteria bacterium]|nr:MAG: hypothetical protein HY931_04070 [Candidatus Falkowbacteria bacterium]
MFNFIENNKILLGLISSVIAVGAYIPYFRDIFKGKTKPHIFSWFIWGLLGGITYIAQVVKGAGAGSWANGLTALICLVIAGLSITRGEKNITLTDKLSFGGAILALILWFLTKNPLSAVILACVIDTLAYVPTFRKAYKKPFEETLPAFITTTIGIIISLLALEAYSATTWLYPTVLVISNSLFIVMLLLRRKLIKNNYGKL